MTASVDISIGLYCRIVIGGGLITALGELGCDHPSSPEHRLLLGIDGVKSRARFLLALPDHCQAGMEFWIWGVSLWMRHDEPLLLVVTSRRPSAASAESSAPTIDSAPSALVNSMCWPHARARAVSDSPAADFFFAIIRSATGRTCCVVR